MLRQTTRKFAIIATVVFSCVAVAACGSTGSAGNDAIRAKEIAATRAVVTTAAEKTEATTTTTSSTETTTSKSKTTTTTTAATTTAEPKTKTTTTTTTAATTTAEPETSTKLETSTESKAETTESATETIESSAAETTESEAPMTEETKGTDIEPMEDNPEGMYPMEECFRRKVEEVSGQSVVKIVVPKYAVVEDGKRYFLASNGAKPGDITNIEDYILDTEEKVDGYDGIIWYAPNALE